MLLAKYIFYLHVLKAGKRRDFYWKLRFKRFSQIKYVIFFIFLFHDAFRDEYVTINGVWRGKENDKLLLK